jgi:hypothetical protein
VEDDRVEMDTPHAAYSSYMCCEALSICCALQDYHELCVIENDWRPTDPQLPHSESLVHDHEFEKVLVRLTF